MARTKHRWDTIRNIYRNWKSEVGRAVPLGARTKEVAALLEKASKPCPVPGCTNTFTPLPGRKQQICPECFRAGRKP